MSTIFLFQTKEYILLSQESISVRNINLPMIQYNTKIYKGINNSLDFQVKNNDRKAVSLAGLQLLVRIQNVETQEILIEKPAIIIDDKAGKAQLILTPEEISNWTTGSYQYNVQTTDINGIDKYLFTDLDRNTFGQFELIEGIASRLAPAIEIDNNMFMAVPYGDYSTLWTSGAYPGDAQSNLTNGMHTIAVYNTNFTGKFWIQISLSVELPYEYEWSNVPIGINTDYYLFTSDTPPIMFFNFNLDAYWVRFQYYTDPLNTGTFDKILFKN